MIFYGIIRTKQFNLDETRWRILFSINEYVFYGSGGICKIVDVQKAPLAGMPDDCQYYVLHSVTDRSSVMYVPVESDRVFLRPLMTPEEAEELINEISAICPIDESNAKLLRERYNECMHCHTPNEWIRVIKTVFLRANAIKGTSRRLSDTERGFYDSAKKYLCTELSVCLNMSVEQAEKYIRQYIDLL